jgi:hypothetical protein
LEALRRLGGFEIAALAGSYMACGTAVPRCRKLVSFLTHLSRAGSSNSAGCTGRTTPSGSGHASG